MVTMGKFKKIIWGFRYKRAVRQAKKKAAMYNTTFLVLMVGGKLRVCSRKRLKELIRQHYFVKGTTIQTLDAAAVYIAK